MGCMFGGFIVGNSYKVVNAVVAVVVAVAVVVGVKWTGYLAFEGNALVVPVVLLTSGALGGFIRCVRVILNKY